MSEAIIEGLILGSISGPLAETEAQVAAFG